MLVRRSGVEVLLLRLLKRPGSLATAAEVTTLLLQANDLELAVLGHGNQRRDLLNISATLVNTLLSCEWEPQTRSLAHKICLKHVTKTYVFLVSRSLSQVAIVHVLIFLLT